MTARSFADHFERAAARLDYWVEGASLEFTEELSRVMALDGVSRAKLARKLDTSPSYVTQVLRGDANFTLETMVKLARALDMELHLHLSREGSRTRWIDEPVARRVAPVLKPVGWGPSADTWIGFVPEVGVSVHESPGGDYGDTFSHAA